VRSYLPVLRSPAHGHRAHGFGSIARFRRILSMEQRIVSKVYQLDKDVNGHKICLDNWEAFQLRALVSHYSGRTQQGLYIPLLWTSLNSCWKVATLSGRRGGKRPAFVRLHLRGTTPLFRPPLGSSLATANESQRKIALPCDQSTETSWE